MINFEPTLRDRIRENVADLYADFTAELPPGEDPSDWIEIRSQYHLRWTEIIHDEQKAVIQGAKEALAAMVETFSFPSATASENDLTWATKIALSSTQVIDGINARYDQLRAALDRAFVELRKGNEPDLKNFPEDPHLLEKQRLEDAMRRYTIAYHWREEMGGRWVDEFER